MPSPIIDLEKWRQPAGVAIPSDELKFLYIPDDVEAAISFEVAKQVTAYQHENAGTTRQINSALMITMGGLLPGILLYDHIVKGKAHDMPHIEFGMIGVSYYAGPGKRLENPVVLREASINIFHKTVLLIDDLGDYGRTMDFLVTYLEQKGPKKVLPLTFYLKPYAQKLCPSAFNFGMVSQDTWIITPRERVETLMARVPVWRERGADMGECRHRLVQLIGYPQDLVDYYLPIAFHS